MSGIQLLRVVVNERLSAAAVEIFEAVRKTIEGYEKEILQSKQEIRRQRRVLHGVLYPEIKISKHVDSDRDSGDEGPSASSGHHSLVSRPSSCSDGENHPADVHVAAPQDQPQLTFSVWDEDFASDQQQSQEQSPSQAIGPPQTEISQEVQLQDSKEDNDIKFIITPPCVENELEQLQLCAEGGADYLPITSAEQHQMVVEADDRASSSTSVAECDISDEEWKGSMGSQSDDTNSKSKKTTGSCLLMGQKLHLNKKAKSRICCKVCKKTFHAIVSLVNHMEVHPKDVCGVCGEHFENEDGFDVHLKTHVKAGVCSFCGKCFGSSSSLAMHMRIHTGEKPFICSECGKSFNCRHNMMRHIRIHTGEKPYSCTVCGKCFSDYSTLKRHLLVHLHRQNHNPNKTPANKNAYDNEKKSFPKKQQSRTICDVCGKMFHSMVSLVNHAKSHSTDICGVCGMQCDSVENLKLHLKTHKNGKVCEVCGKCFGSRGNMEMHMRIHTGEKPFLCSECGKSFNCRHNMTRHFRTHTGEKPYVCNICGRSFGDHSALKQHSSTHTGEKAHRCDVCGRGFHRKTVMRLHMKNHAAEK